MALVLQAKLSPLHDSAGSQQSSETEDRESSASETSEDLIVRHSRSKSGVSEGENRAQNGTSHQIEQDAAHFIGLPQKKSPLKSRLEPETYELSCSGRCGSLLADSKEVSIAYINL